MLPARAEADICSPEGAGNHATLHQKPEWYNDKLRELEISYYGVSSDNDKKAFRDKYINTRREISDENFRKFASDICARGITLPASDPVATAFKVHRKFYDGFEARLIFKRLQVLRAVQIAKIEASMKKTDANYSLFAAKQELLDWDWTLMLYTAINEVEKIKLDALNAAASGVPAD